MHTTVVETESERITVHHNGDWSGDAIVCREDGSETRIPGKLLVAIGKMAAKEVVVSAVIAAVEDL